MEALEESLVHPFSDAVDEMRRYLIMDQEIFEILLVALLSGGHILLEGYIATGKTLLSKTFARVIGGTFSRIQCTPDLLPSDIIGTFVFNPKINDFVVKRGPIFANVVMVDEIDRANPRTQAAFLEAMQEGQVSIEGRTFELPKPFLVIATRVQGIREEGVFPLPRVSLDRFLFSALLKRLRPEEEARLLDSIDAIEELKVRQVLSPEIILLHQRQARRVYVSPEIKDYIVRLVHALARSEHIEYPPSTRATVALFKGCRAHAYIHGRDYVIPDDVKVVAPFALRHRIFLKPEARFGGVTPEEIIKEALENVPVPR